MDLVSATLTLGIALNALFGSYALAAPASDYYPPEVRKATNCILAEVGKLMHVKIPRNIPRPRVFLSNEITLAEFQDALEPQWGFRPDAISNAYVARGNVIFLRAARNAYPSGRSVFDSLAHELVHYVQVRVLGLRLEDATDEDEYEAVQIQTLFRELWGGHVRESSFHCPIPYGLLSTSPRTKTYR